ncbi:M48 family metallopeptidase [Halothermothrix orenii]|uniref:Predicted metal-dependent hydrolase n=1 Tax=Halothermothrix orenii (strain H 168 / OCM 544 / DSM 9562) TaxID=373903 RepID=B8D1X8_HALOH|nr:SprT family zinc-dependent metalloprotease [Halothermothrix orenii]ACL69205.1 predicted metal-dependent hydrolase [Halothermothrix orenii H 168]
MQQVRIGNTVIKYNIVRTNRKTVGLIVDPEDGVIVRSPERLSDDRIRKLLKKKARWLMEKLRLINEFKPKPASYEFLSGEKLPYLGRKYRLKVTKDDGIKSVKVRLYQGKFEINVSSSIKREEKRDKIRKALIKWYKEHAKDKINERVRIYQNRIGVKPNNIIVKEQKKRWGSCSSKGNININWRIIMAPMSVVDYIVVHELVHLIHPDHSVNFWELVETVITDYREKQKWLRINGRALDF